MAIQLLIDATRKLLAVLRHDLSSVIIELPRATKRLLDRFLFISGMYDGGVLYKGRRRGHLSQNNNANIICL
jgi:hypothetical protein